MNGNLDQFVVFGVSERTGGRRGGRRCRQATHFAAQDQVTVAIAQNGNARTTPSMRSIHDSPASASPASATATPANHGADAEAISAFDTLPAA